MIFPASVASSFRPEPLYHRGAGIFLFPAVLMGLSHLCKEICNGGRGCCDLGHLSEDSYGCHQVRLLTVLTKRSVTDKELSELG